MKSKLSFVAGSFLLILAITVSVVNIIRNQNTYSNDIVASEQNDENTSSELKTPTLDTKVIISNLENPWDITFISDDKFIFTERGNKINIVENNQIIKTTSLEDTYVRGEGGMMSISIDPDFEQNKNIYVCFNSNANNSIDVKVVKFRLNEDHSLADRQDLIIGIPSNSSGRHSGCQLEFGPDGYLWIGTGDAAIGTHPQDPKSLGGKILRIDTDGNPAPGNLEEPFDSRIYSYGHRNTQGITFLESSQDIQGLSSEHGPSMDDEINILESGNFGWNPVPGYSEGVPMTDFNQYSDAIGAVWSSGSPTLAISGLTQIKGEEWSLWNGYIAVAALKVSQIKIFRLNENKLEEVQTILRDVGRIRTVQQGLDGSLYILTDNGFNDVIVKVSVRPNVI
jgi:glucose/arabinose dehydrogenase